MIVRSCGQRRRLARRAPGRGRRTAPCRAPVARTLRARGSGGFTLVEIITVTIIVGIVAAISLSVLVRALEAARVRRTEALIQKLDRALQDHLQDVLARTANVTPSTLDLQLSKADPNNAGESPDYERARVIARKRLLKEEVPQLFMVIDATTTPPDVVGDWDALALDLGSGGPPLALPPDGTYDTFQSASDRSGAAQEYRQRLLGVHQNELDEGRPGLENHEAPTASAECLYMILARAARIGTSSLDPADLTSGEVTDTDDDGLPEFVDAWGNPLRFYRLPVFFQSDLQKGNAPYAVDDIDGDATDEQVDGAEDDPHDPNRTLVMEPWWGTTKIDTLGNGQVFDDVNVFESAVSISASGALPPAFLLPAFHSLTDPQGGADAQSWNWDNANDTNFANYGVAARAYDAVALIASAGPDGLFGIYPTDERFFDSANFLGTRQEALLVAGAAPMTEGLLENPQDPPASLSAEALWWFTMLNVLGAAPDDNLQQMRIEVEAYLDNVSNHGLRAD